MPDRDRSPSAGPVATEAEHWGARAQRLRDALGLSRAAVAATLVRMGRRTQPHNVREWEEGRITPRIETFGALARVLGVSIETLLYGEAEAVRIARERACAESPTHGEPADAAD